MSPASEDRSGVLCSGLHPELAEQARNGDHDSSDPCSQAKKQPGSESSTCCAGAYSPWPPPFAPPTPLRPPPQTPPQGAFLALFAGFTATMTRSDFSCPCIIGFGSSPPRCGPSRSRNSDGQTRDLPGSDAIPLHVMWPLTPAGRQHLA